MKKLIFLIPIFIFLSSGFSQIESNLYSTIFYKKGFGVNVSMTLTLTKDFTFTEHTKALSCVDRSISSNTISGTFKISKNRLILTPKKLLYYDFQGNCSKLEETDTIIKSGCFITEYKIVKYKDLILLLNDFTNTGNYPNDFIDIANSINRKDSNTEIRYI